MPYGTVKVDNVTFTNNSVDATTTFSGIYASITNNLTLSGTATAATFTGTTANFTNVNAQNISVTTSLSGLAITGGTAGFTTITGTTVTGTTANFATLSGTTVTGTTANFVTVSGTTVTGNTGQFTNLAGAAAGFTTVTGTTITGTTANFVSGVFTTRILGTTVTGTTASFTSGVFTSLSGTTHTITSGVFASGTAALPSISFVSDPNTGIYSPDADQLAVATNGTGRLFIDASGVVKTNNSIRIANSGGGEATLIFTGTPSDVFPELAGIYSDSNYGVNTATALLVKTTTAGDTSPTERLRITGAGTLNFKGAGTAGSTQAVSFDGSAPVNSLVIDSSGRLGIGTSSPGFITHISTGDASSITAPTAGSFGLYIQQNTSGSKGGLCIQDGASNTGDSFKVVDNNNGTRFVIDADGKVGIGTSNPKIELQTGTSGGIQALNATEIALRYNLYNSSGDKYIQAAYKAASMVMNSDGDFLFYNTNTASTAADSAVTGLTARMAIKASGNVGIGSTVPNEKLTVADSGSANVYIALQNSTTGTTSADGWYLGAAGTEFQIYGKENGPITFSLNSSEKARIDTSGRLLVGTSTDTNNARLQEKLALVTIGSGNIGGMAITNYGGTSAGSRPLLDFQRSRGTTDGSFTAVASGDQLGSIIFRGADGSQFVDAAFINCEVDGTPGANDMPGRLVFSTTADGASSPTQRMVIKQNGAVGIQATPGVYGGEGATLVLDGSGRTQTVFSNINGTSSATHYSFGNGNGVVGTITTSGSSTAYNTSSDYRLKENVAAVTDGITRLQQLKPSRFNFIVDSDKTVDGFIAHEVQDIVPEAITGEKDAVDDDGNPVYQGIDQSKLVPLLTAALQEAIAKIESLEARLTAAGID